MYTVGIFYLNTCISESFYLTNLLSFPTFKLFLKSPPPPIESCIIICFKSKTQRIPRREIALGFIISVTYKIT